MSHGRQRLYAILVAAGALILLARTVVMLLGGALEVLVAWVGALLLAEFALDLAWFAAAVRWLWSRAALDARLALKAAGAAILLHAVRVMIFVLGRTGPWIDFDVRPEERAFHAARWSWEGVYFAATMALLGVIGVALVWRLRRRADRPMFGENRADRTHG